MRRPAQIRERPLTSLELDNQIANPRHVHIKCADGSMVSHQESAFTPSMHSIVGYWKGQPIRFTTLAAKRLLASGNPLYKGATLVPVGG